MMRIAAVIATIALLGAARAQASAKASAQVKAAKGPVEITLSLQKTKVKSRRSLWYKLALKNVSKQKIQVFDQIFKDPYAMHVNAKSRQGLYVEIVDSKGKPVGVKAGNYRVKYDWEPPEDTDYLYTTEEKNELWALQQEWKKSGMTPQQLSLAEDAWINKLRDKKNMAELADPANRHWLEPGASTTTFAWADRGPGEYAGRAEDDESLREGYTQLWVYMPLKPGKYRVRAVYNHSRSETNKEHIEKYGVPHDSGWIEFKTPFIGVEVLR